MEHGRHQRRGIGNHLRQPGIHHIHLRDGHCHLCPDLVGTNPSSAIGDFSDSNADPENDGFTRLCDYLAWLVLPSLETTAGGPADLDLSPLTKGYTASPLRTVQVAFSSSCAGTVQLLGDGKTARFATAPGFSCIARITHTVTDSAGDSMTGDFVVRVLSEPDAYGQFVLANGLDPGTTGDTNADPDHDGLANALEFLLGGNPDLSDVASKGPADSRSPGGGFDFTYDRKTAAAGLFGDVVETSTNLTSWTPAIHGVAGAAISITPLCVDTERVSVHFLAAGRLFARLRATGSE